MVRATTPTLTLTINDESVDLTAARNVYVTLEQNNTTLTKTGEELDVEARVVKVWLSQTESLALSEGQPLNIQINWTYIDADGVTVKRAATNVAKITITRQLLDEVIA